MIQNWELNTGAWLWWCRASWAREWRGSYKMRARQDIVKGICESVPSVLSLFASNFTSAHFTNQIHGEAKVQRSRRMFVCTMKILCYYYERLHHNPHVSSYTFCSTQTPGPHWMVLPILKVSFFFSISSLTLLPNNSRYTVIHIRKSTL